jgi:nicotinamidase-related amidase
MAGTSGLVIVDVQRYYLDPAAPFYRWAENRHRGAMSYISKRCNETAIPNIMLMLLAFRKAKLPVFFLRLCGTAPDRSDLHRFFRKANDRACMEGFPGIYPLENDALADMDQRVSPLPGEHIVNKTSFSGFSSGDFATRIRESGIDTLFMTGLATSQCVETTARDASDRGYSIVMVEDAMADYDQDTHQLSLYSSQAVCGGFVVTASYASRDIENVAIEAHQSL